jgi:N-sulfoglucosamine sulfohydrolase
MRIFSLVSGYTKFFKMLLRCIVACLPLYTIRATSQPNPQPKLNLNVLLIVTDDQGMQAGYLGTPGVSTPAMDGLASEGVAFKKAYCTFPSCSPSRAGILTGTYPHVNGITTNVFEYLGATPPESWVKQTASLHDRFHLGDGVATLVEVLKAAGYYTGIAGKFHIVPHTKFPFDFWTKTFTENNANDFFSRVDKKPFFFAYNSHHPHRPFVKNTDERVVEAKLKEGKLQVPAFLPNTPLMQRDWAEYLTAIEEADKDLADVLKMIKQRKGEGNTLIVFVGDNGSPFHRGKYTPYNLGTNCPLIIAGPGVQKNVFTNTLVSFADIMPTILDMANINIPSSVNGKSLKPFLTGQSQMDIHDFVVSETAFSRSNEPNYQARSVFDNRFVYIRSNGKPRVKLSPADMYLEKGWNNHSYQATMEAKDEFPLQYQLLQTLENTPPVEELFDLHTDPWCMYDISKNPDYKNQLGKMQKDLDAWIIATNDKEMMKK